MIHFDIEQFDHSLIICPDASKRSILEDLYKEKRIADLKFMSLSEYRKKYYFDYDFKAIRYLNETHGLSISNAKEILDRLYLAEDGRIYHNEKLGRLVSYKKELYEKGLLIYDPFFLPSIRDRKVFVIGYGQLLEEDARIINGTIIPYEKKEKKYQISCFEEIEEEVLYLYDAISDLLENGEDINHIHVMNATDDYRSYFKRFNEYYGFLIDLKDDDVLSGTALANEFLDMIDTYSKEEIYEYLKEKGEIGQKLIDIINRYPEYDLKDVKTFLIEDLNKGKIRRLEYRNVVSCDDLYTSYEEGDHVFLIGFNDGFPVLKRDTDYITDSIAPLVNVSDCETKNALIRRNVRAYLSNIDHLYISYSKKSPFNTYEFSNLYFESEYEKIIPQKDPDHSKLYNRLKCGYLLDHFYRYNEVDEDLGALYRNHSDIPYGNYDNRFKGLSEDQIDQISKIRLSYSSMDKFYKCAFAYYIENILGLNNFEDTFYTLIGTLCHEVLKDLYRDKDFDFERSWKYNFEKLKDSDPGFSTGKDLFFVEKVKEELRKDVEIIEKQKASMNLDKQICENDFHISVDEKLEFKGFIDKVMYYEGKDEVVADVVDYKTGNSAKIKKKLIPYGLCLQLPSYMYLLKKDNPFEKPIRFGGFYLQHLINSDLNFDEEKDRDQIKEESMKLEGFTTADIDRITFIDQSIDEGRSKNIKGLRFKNDGTYYANSPIVSDEEIDEMTGTVEGLIEKAKERIFEGDFKIDPKEIDGVNESCGYCPYRFLCYVRYRDLVSISTKEKDDGTVD